ncbi:MAG: hypothetical protein CL792_03310 [Chloroflexi bacterium]|nr:hypothetical protein [Chloroflexota bacterium]|tara:strand:- start:2951 stop:3775 length:825 start_codon:yes stop_codon:yes gene_type:complete
MNNIFFDSKNFTDGFRSKWFPSLFSQLANDAPNYLSYIWPTVIKSINTQGFLGSALYMTDMALDACELVYEPQTGRADLITQGMTNFEIQELEAVLDLFHYVQPQVLLIGAALAEAFEREKVGGQGSGQLRKLSDREKKHLLTEVKMDHTDAPNFSNIVDILQLSEAPDLYRALGEWQLAIDIFWGELQHLATYPDFRRRGRALYYYARAGSKFLAVPLNANFSSLNKLGISSKEIIRAQQIVNDNIPVLAMMIMHCTAMRLALGHSIREMVQS